MARGRKKLEPVESGFLALGDNASAVLKGYINEIDKIDDKLDELRSQRKDVLVKAKANGFNTRPLKEVLRQRKMEEATRLAFTEEVDKMKKALGMMDLFEYADSLDATGKSTEAEADDLAA